MMSKIKENFLALDQEITKIAKEKNVKRPTLIAVSKTFPYEDIKEVREIPHFDFGENRVQELVEKGERAVEDNLDIKFHFIGHLQSNKIKKLLEVPYLHSIHSIENQKQVELILKSTKKVNYFLQVNTSFETEKGGIDSISEVLRLWEFSKAQSGSSPMGLMTIGKIRTDDFIGDAKKSFSMMNEIKVKIKKEFNDDAKLSMGMSQDFHIAIEYGTDFLRIGSRIFGER